MKESYSKAKIFRLSGVAFLIGIILSYFFSFYFLIVFLFLILVYFYVTENKQIEKLTIFFVLLFLIFGFLNYKFALKKLSSNILISQLENKPFLIVFSEEISNYQKLIIKPLKRNNFKGGVIITDLKPTYLKGEIIYLKGKIQKIDKPFYSNSLFIVFKSDYPQIVKTPFKNLSLSLNIFKSKIKNIFFRFLKEKEAKLLTSLIFGQRGNLDKETKRELNLAGLSHLVAVSGLHLILLTEILNNLLNYFSINRFLKSVLLFFILLFFAFLADFTPSITRALTMAFLLILAELNFRMYHSLNALIFTALIMTIFNPFILIYDLGFQLSFLATLGIIIFSPILKETKFLKQLPLFKTIKETIILTLSSIILVYPWLIFKVGEVSLVSLFSNILVLPLISYILILAFLLVIFSVFPFINLFLGWLLNFCLGYILRICEIFSFFKFSAVSFPYYLRVFSLIIYFFIVFYYLKYKKEKILLKKENDL